LKSFGREIFHSPLEQDDCDAGRSGRIILLALLEEAFKASEVAHLMILVWPTLSRQCETDFPDITEKSLSR
jgi:hypothetical protein